MHYNNLLGKSLEQPAKATTWPRLQAHYAQVCVWSFRKRIYGCTNVQTLLYAFPCICLLLNYATWMVTKRNEVKRLTPKSLAVKSVCRLVSVRGRRRHPPSPPPPQRTHRTVKLIESFSHRKTYTNAMSVRVHRPTACIRIPLKLRLCSSVQWFICGYFVTGLDSEPWDVRQMSCKTRKFELRNEWFCDFGAVMFKIHNLYSSPSQHVKGM